MGTLAGPLDPRNFPRHLLRLDCTMRYHGPMRRAVCIALLLLASACTVSNAVEKMQRESPPAELGRPEWVRSAAGTGAWIGGSVGLLVSVVLLPVSYPLSLLADEPLGLAKREFLWWPTYGGAATGHFLLGAPTDFLDFTFHRAWTGTPSPAERDFGFTPMEPPVGPAARPPVTEDTGDADTGEEVIRTDPDRR